MSDKLDLTALPLPQLAARCRQESDQFYKDQPNNPIYCFELFRRAILAEDKLAWQAVYQQYQPVVTNWVTACPAYTVTGEQVDYFVNWAYAKFWTAVTPEKFSNFPDLPALLRYLKMCVFSVVTDYARLKELANHDPTVDPDIFFAVTGEDDLEEKVLTRTHHEQLWQLVQDRLNSDREYAAIYGSYILGLKPRQVQREFSHLFDHPRDVSRTKENVLARLQRDTGLMNLLRDA